MYCVSLPFEASDYPLRLPEIYYHKARAYLIGSSTLSTCYKVFSYLLHSLPFYKYVPVCVYTDMCMHALLQMQVGEIIFSLSFFVLLEFLLLSAVQVSVVRDY